jgi:hypothetical protein
MTKHIEILSIMFRGIIIIQFFVYAISRTDKPEVAALIMRKALLPYLLTRSPAGSMSKADERFPMLMTSAFSNSVAPVSLR